MECAILHEHGHIGCLGSRALANKPSTLSIVSSSKTDDQVRSNCELDMLVDCSCRPTLWKMEHGDYEKILIVGDWAIDPNGSVLDIVHVCDAENKFFSPTLFTTIDPVENTHNNHVSVHKSAYEFFDKTHVMVCVTCGAKPKADVTVALELLWERLMKMRMGTDSVF